MKEIKSVNFKLICYRRKRVVGFGKNDKGQLGDGTNKDALIPKKLTDMKVKAWQLELVMQL